MRNWEIICCIPRRNKRNCSHSLNDVNSLQCLVWFFLYYLVHLFSSDCFTPPISLQPYKFFIWIYEFFKNHPQRRVIVCTEIPAYHCQWKPMVNHWQLLLNFPVPLVNWWLVKHWLPMGRKLPMLWLVMMYWQIIGNHW